MKLPASVTAKVLLLNTMQESKIKPSELAKKLGVKQQEINRLTDLTHHTKIDRIADALSVMGKTLKLSVS